MEWLLIALEAVAAAGGDFRPLLRLVLAECFRRNPAVMSDLMKEESRG